MSPGDQVDSVLSVEFLYNFPTKQVACAARTNHPARNVIRVGPHEVAHGSVMRHFLLAVDLSDFVERGDARAQTSMHAENAFVNDGSKGQEIKNFSAVAPYIHGPVLAEAFVVEAVDLSDLTGLVVASDESDAFGVANLNFSLS